MVILGVTNCFDPHMQVAALHIDINSDRWYLVHINNYVNSTIRFLKNWGGNLGIILISPLIFLLLVIVFLIAKYYSKKAHKYLTQLQIEISTALEDGQIDDPEFSRWIMEFGADLIKMKNMLSEMKTNRKHSSSLIMKRFLRLENDLFEHLETIDNEVKYVLYPSLNKDWSQKELQSMLERSKGVPDLDDPDMDLLMEQYA